jgi:hypothetical protein
VVNFAISEFSGFTSPALCALIRTEIPLVNEF